MYILLMNTHGDAHGWPLSQPGAKTQHVPIAAGSAVQFSLDASAWWKTLLLHDVRNLWYLYMPEFFIPSLNWQKRPLKLNIIPSIWENYRWEFCLIKLEFRYPNQNHKDKCFRSRDVDNYMHIPHGPMGVFSSNLEVKYTYLVVYLQMLWASKTIWLHQYDYY